MFHVKHFLYHGRGCAQKKEVFHVKHLLLSEISLYSYSPRFIILVIPYN